MIHVCFGLHDKTGHYSKFTGTTMLSIFENVNTPPRSTTVHILHDNTLTLDNREKFSYVAGQYNQLVKFYNVEELCADKISDIKKFMPGIVNTNFTIASLYRLLIPQLLPADVDKCIYLDSDIIVNLDINELWRIELSYKILGVIPEVLNGVNTRKTFKLVADNLIKPEDYFNSGVLLMNLKIFRAEEDLIMDGINFISKNPAYKYFDQEILNYCFSTRTLKLPLKYNLLVNNLQYEQKIKKGIYHFAGGAFAKGMNNPFNRLWMKYFVKTPWFNEESFGRFYAGVQGLHVGLKNFALQVSTIMSGKTRAFFTFPQNVDALKKIFSVRDDEEIILAENQESLQKLIDAMKLSGGKKVFFIVLQVFPLQILIQAGFVYGRDFLNGFDFLSDAHGIPLDSYPMIQAM